MTTAIGESEATTYYLGEGAKPLDGKTPADVVNSRHFRRKEWDSSGNVSTILDEFVDDKASPRCFFVRFTAGPSRVVRIAVKGTYRIVSCPSGGWLLEPEDVSMSSYWIPRQPMLRTLDPHDRILLEEPASVLQFDVSAQQLAVKFRVPGDANLDLVCWQLPQTMTSLAQELKELCALELHPTFLWSSQTVCTVPSDTYLHLVHGQVYQNARAWPRRWKFCCELDAFELYLRLSGLELATKKRLYNYLRRQILFSVVARQSQDGGWYHGEWTDMKECHYRFHNGALLLIENALDEWPGDVLRESLVKGISFVASFKDQTELGVWFLHDSLEESPEKLDAMFEQTGSLVKGFGAWKPSYFLGKSGTNKMILNTHIDTTIVLRRYEELTTDTAFSDDVESACRALRVLLARRPAELLYRLVNWAIGLTLLPEGEAKRLPLPMRALKRLTWMYITPNFYRLKHRFPRLVMPGGFIDRHLSPPHFDAKYHAVNVLDLVRYWRRFPEERLQNIIDDAVSFVMGKDRAVLRWWAESEPRKFAVAVFAEALYQLCMLKRDARYREYLARVILCIEDFQLGLPPSLLGGNCEILKPSQQTPCPIPLDSRLRVVNLSGSDQREVLVVNPTDTELELAWQVGATLPQSWKTADTMVTRRSEMPTSLAPRRWVLGADSISN